MTTQDGMRIAGRYRLVDQLGRGGMGTVWRAVDEVLGREVAVKEVMLPPTVDSATRDDLVARTRREARLAARLNHPNVVTVFDVVDEDGRPWVVMELVPSRSLTQIVEAEGPMSPPRAAELGLQLLGALDAAHRAGILHRDVKPGNVLVTSDGRVVLSDFGIARLEGDPALTGTGLIMGSPAYMAPERARGEKVGPASDLWSLGATLYTAVEGRPAFSRGGAVPTLAAVVTDDPDPYQLAGPLVPLLQALLDRDPTARPGSAEVRAQLRRVAAMPSAGAPPAAPADGTPLREVQRTRTLPPPPSEDPAVADGPSPDGAAPAPVPALVADEPSSADEAPLAADEPSSADEAPLAADPVPTEASADAVPTGAGAGVSTGPDEPARPVDEAAVPATGTATGTARVTGRVPAPLPPPGAAAPPESPAVTPPAESPAVTPPPESPAVTPPRRRRALLAAAAVVVLAAAAVLVWVSLRDDPTTRPPATGTSAGATATAMPGRATPTPEQQQPTRTATPSRTASPQQSTGTAIPDGYTRRTDPSGFSIAIPAGWTVMRDGPGNRFVYWSDPNSDRYLLIDRTDTPKDDPVADWREQSATRSRTMADYQEIRIEAVDYFLRAADWEFTYTHPDYGPVHVLNRGFVTSEQRGYALYWLTPADEWDTSRDEFAVFARTFRPAR